MDFSFLENIKLSTVFKIFLFLILILILPTFTSYSFIKQSSLESIEKSIRLTITNVDKDIKYNNGKWNVELYNSDPDTHSLISASPFPLYIITAEGYIIDRSQPISGLLDSTDFKHLLSFSEIQTFTSPTNEKWRIISSPVKSDGKTIGVITVSYYNPPTTGITSQIDSQLLQSLNYISNKIKIKKNQIIINNADLKDIPYYISYEVNSYLNKVIASNGRVPAFIDVSHIAPELSADKRIVADQISGERFLIVSQAILDSKGLPVGVIVAGKSVNDLNLLLDNFLIFSFATRVILTIPLTLFAIYILRKELADLLNRNNKNIKFKKISFNKKSGSIFIDKREIQIPYASNQYYLCKAIFSEPKKSWEVDELLEKFGEEAMSGASRKIYDALLAINKKTGIRLIVHKNKRYKFNSEFISRLSS